MTEIECTELALIIHIQGADKIWSLKSQIQVPWEHVLGAERDPAVVENWGKIDWHTLRAPGASIPGMIKAGSYLNNGQWVFYDVHDPSKTISIRIVDEHYTRLVVEVVDPDGTLAAIEQALHTYKRA